MEDTRDYPDCVKECLDESETLPKSVVKEERPFLLKAEKTSHDAFSDKMACLLLCHYDYKIKKDTKDRAPEEHINFLMDRELERMSKKDFKLDT